MQEAKGNPYKHPSPKQHIFNMGYASAQNGFPKTTNPYLQKDLDWYADCWNEGWDHYTNSLHDKQKDKQLFAIIDEWHNGKHQGRTLAEVMGMSDEQYKEWAARHPFSKPNYIETSMGQWRGRIYRWPIYYGAN